MHIFVLNLSFLFHLLAIRMLSNSYLPHRYPPPQIIVKYKNAIIRTGAKFLKGLCVWGGGVKCCLKVEPKVIVQLS